MLSWLALRLLRLTLRTLPVEERILILGAAWQAYVLPDVARTYLALQQLQVTPTQPSQATERPN